MFKHAIFALFVLILIAGCGSKPETDEDKLNALAASFGKDYCAVFNTGDQKAAEHLIGLYDPNAKHRPPTPQSVIKFIRQDYHPDAELSFASIRNVAVQGYLAEVQVNLKLTHKKIGQSAEAVVTVQAVKANNQWKVADFHF